MARPRLYSTKTPNLKRDTKRSEPKSRYYADLYIGGRRDRSFLGYDKKEAEKKLANIRVRLDELAKQDARGSSELHKGPQTLKELQDLNREREEPRVRPETFRRWRSQDKIALNRLGNLPLKSINQQELEAYQRELIPSYKPSSVNQHLSRLTSLLRWAIKNGYLDQDPSKGLAPLKNPEKRIRYLLNWEEKALKEACEGDFWDYIHFALLTGLRISEQLFLTWREVSTGKIVIEGDRSKNLSLRKVPLNKGAKKILERRRGIHEELVFPTSRGGRWAQQNFSVRHWSLVRAASGVKDFRWHDLRHTFCSRLVMAGVSLLAVKELAGHSSLEMTMKYAHLAPGHLSEAIEKLH